MFLFFFAFFLSLFQFFLFGFFLLFHLCCSFSFLIDHVSWLHCMSIFVRVITENVVRNQKCCMPCMHKNLVYDEDAGFDAIGQNAVCKSDVE